MKRPLRGVVAKGTIPRFFNVMGQKILYTFHVCIFFSQLLSFSYELNQLLWFFRMLYLCLLCVFLLSPHLDIIIIFFYLSCDLPISYSRASLYGASPEALASLTRHDFVVDTTSLVSTNYTYFHVCTPFSLENKKIIW